MEKKEICFLCKKGGIRLCVNTRHVRKGKVFEYKVCMPCNTARMKKYRSTTNGKLATRKAVAKSIKKHIDKQNARVYLNRLVRSGEIKRPAICSKCLDTKKVEGHHTDYTKPLDVIWLCRQCHCRYDKL